MYKAKNTPYVATKKSLWEISSLFQIFFGKRATQNTLLERLPLCSTQPMTSPLISLLRESHMTPWVLETRNSNIKPTILHVSYPDTFSMVVLENQKQESIWFEFDRLSVSVSQTSKASFQTLFCNIFSSHCSLVGVGLSEFLTVAFNTYCFRLLTRWPRHAFANCTDLLCAVWNVWDNDERFHRWVPPPAEEQESGVYRVHVFCGVRAGDPLRFPGKLARDSIPPWIING